MSIPCASLLEHRSMELLSHQQRIININPKKAILNWEMRVGKTLPAVVWIDLPEQAGNTYIITLKKNKQEWVNMGTKAIVITKEEFKRMSHTILNPTAIVVDEAHYFASGLFIKGRSQLSATLYELLKKYPDCHILLLTATPIRQNAWSLHTLLCYIGIYYPWKEWRGEFFVKEEHRFLKRQPWMKAGEVPMAWMPKRDWRMNIRKYIEVHTDIVSLRDIVEDLPPAESRIIKVKGEKYKKPKDEIVTWTHEHKHEQKGKVNEILELGYRKVIIVCMYTSQIDELVRELSSEKPVFVLDGRTKDQSAVIATAQASDECYLICQSAMGETWDGWMFGCMVFVSMSHSCYQYTQMMGRQRHPKHLKVTETIYLIGGKWDQRIYDNVVTMGRDFNPHIYLNEPS